MSSQPTNKEEYAPLIAGRVPGRDDGRVPVVLGVDIGSLYAKVVCMTADRHVLSHSCMKSGTDYRQACRTGMEQALGKAGLVLEDVRRAVATGYGRLRVDFADTNVSEITCHARGMNQVCPQARTIIDIGGQDSKAIHLDENGCVLNFVMNDKCAAGTGRFLEVMAAALGVDFDRMSELAFNSRNRVSVSSMCTVFAESEVISLIASGTTKEDIASALFRSIATRVSGMVGHLGGIREQVAMSGGVAKSKGMVRALEGALGTTIYVPPEPQIIGALGAAIIAAEQVPC